MHSLTIIYVIASIIVAHCISGVLYTRIVSASQNSTILRTANTQVEASWNKILVAMMCDWFCIGFLAVRRAASVLG